MLCGTPLFACCLQQTNEALVGKTYVGPKQREVIFSDRIRQMKQAKREKEVCPRRQVIRTDPLPQLACAENWAPLCQMIETICATFHGVFLSGPRG